MPRITAGKLKNRKLLCLEGTTTRPTLEKTRAAILNSLSARFHLEQFEVIDPFAGTGAMALEAHSWGAGKMRLVEQNAKAFRLLQQNLQSMGLENVAGLSQAEGVSWLKRADLSHGPYLVFLDPPYGKGLAQQALDVLAERRGELKGSIIVLERDAKDEVTPPQGWTLFLQKKVGKTKLDFFEMEEP